MKIAFTTMPTGTSADLFLELERIFKSMVAARSADLVLIGGVTPAGSEFTPDQMLTILQGLASQHAVFVYFTPGPKDDGISEALQEPGRITDLRQNVQLLGTTCSSGQEDLIFTAVGYPQMAEPPASSASFPIDPVEAAIAVADGVRSLLITHQPPAFIMDEICERMRPVPADLEASIDLMSRIERAVTPQLHVFSSSTRITGTLLNGCGNLVRRWEGLEPGCPTHLWDSDTNSFTKLEEQR